MLFHGHYKLVDYGSCVRAGSLAVPGFTPRYCSPEMARCVLGMDARYHRPDAMPRSHGLRRSRSCSTEGGGSGGNDGGSGGRDVHVSGWGRPRPGNRRRRRRDSNGSAHGTAPAGTAAAAPGVQPAGVDADGDGGAAGGDFPPAALPSVPRLVGFGTRPPPTPPMAVPMGGAGIGARRRRGRGTIPTPAAHLGGQPARQLSASLSPPVYTRQRSQSSDGTYEGDGDPMSPHTPPMSPPLGAWGRSSPAHTKRYAVKTVTAAQEPPNSPPLMPVRPPGWFSGCVRTTAVLARSLPHSLVVAHVCAWCDATEVTRPRCCRWGLPTAHHHARVCSVDRRAP